MAEFDEYYLSAEHCVFREYKITGQRIDHTEQMTDNDIEAFHQWSDACDAVDKTIRGLEPKASDITYENEYPNICYNFAIVIPLSGDETTEEVDKIIATSFPSSDKRADIEKELSEKAIGYGFKFERIAPVRERVRQLADELGSGEDINPKRGKGHDDPSL